MSKNKQINIAKTRIIFPRLFELSVVDGKFVKTEADRRYSCTFLLSKDTHSKVIEDINIATESIMKDLKIKKLPHSVITCCDEQLGEIFDGDEAGAIKKKAMSYKAGHFELQAKSVSQPTLRKIRGVDLDVTKDEDPFYPGCYVNAIIELAPYDNAYGKGISKYLKYVLFSKHGEKLATSNGGIDGDKFFEEDDDVEDDFKDADLF